MTATGTPAPVDRTTTALLARYLEAFERYDMEALVSLIREDATQSMPPYDLWLSGRDDILLWWVGPGAGCRGSRLVPAGVANGAPAFGQYEPRAVLELEGGRIVELTFFLETETVFRLFGLPLEPDSQGRSARTIGPRAAREIVRGAGEVTRGNDR